MECVRRGSQPRGIGRTGALAEGESTPVGRQLLGCCFLPRGGVACVACAHETVPSGVSAWRASNAIFPHPRLLRCTFQRGEFEALSP